MTKGKKMVKKDEQPAGQPARQQQPQQERKGTVNFSFATPAMLRETEIEARQLERGGRGVG